MLSKIATAALEELEKLALDSLRALEKHHNAKKKNWKVFEKNLKDESFVQEVLRHPKSDNKLKKYVVNFTDYLKSKKVVGHVKSSSSKKKYKVKELSTGKLGCGCKDWQYVGSVSGEDCKHIKQLTRLGE